VKRHLVTLTVGCALMLLAGCDVYERVIWSPDGKRAIVNAGEGVVLCDHNGDMLHTYDAEPSPLRQFTATWCPDSQQFVAVRRSYVKSWQDYIEVAGTVSARRYEHVVLLLIDAFENNLNAKGELEEVPGLDLDELSWLDESNLWLCAMERYPGPLQNMLSKMTADERDDVPLDDPRAVYDELVLCHVDKPAADDAVVLLTAGPGDIGSIDVSPDGRYISCTIDDKLVTMPFDRSTGLVEVAEGPVLSHAWSPDSQRLVCAVEEGGRTGESDDLRLGTVLEQRVRDGEGELLAERPAPRQLAGAIVSERTRVRYLDDDRILFSSLEISLPVVSADFPGRSTIFTVELEGKTPVLGRLLSAEQEARLPDRIDRFELSPDRKWLTVPGTDGAVALVEIASGKITTIQANYKLPDENRDERQIVPTWLSNGAFVFRVAANHPAGSTNRSEIVVYSIADEEIDRCISLGWSDDAAGSFLHGGD
jgi:hypothetical protein